MEIVFKIPKKVLAYSRCTINVSSMNVKTLVKLEGRGEELF